MKYYSTGDNVSNLNDPLPTITSKERIAVVKTYFKKLNNTKIGNWPHIRDMLNTYLEFTIKDDEIMVFSIDNEEYIMVDIEMRMLLPKELYAAQGFPLDYIFEVDEKYSKAKQIARVGNSVPPALVEALVRSNIIEEATPKFETMKSLTEYMTS
jgi:DNA (cytosine-5)-methyltransferase 1